MNYWFSCVIFFHLKPKQREWKITDISISFFSSHLSGDVKSWRMATLSGRANAAVSGKRKSIVRRKKAPIDFYRYFCLTAILWCSVDAGASIDFIDILVSMLWLSVSTFSDFYDYISLVAPRGLTRAMMKNDDDNKK